MKILKKIKLSTTLLSLFTLALLVSCKDNSYSLLEGFAQGTTYHISYSGGVTSKVESAIDSLFKVIDNSLSVYNPNSLISKINRGERVPIDSHFSTVFNRAKEIYLLSEGAFDPSASPLFNLWGFGFEKRDSITQERIDRAIALSGMDKIELSNGYLNFAVAGMELNFNAIAKGYSCDLIARELELMGIENYIVEIGGEIHSKGQNSRGKSWSIGIDKPIDGNMIPGASIEDIIVLPEGGLATSGNYRQFWREGDQIYSHTIDPKSGYPARNTLLSATVIAPDTMSADAYATWFMVIGLEKAKEVIANSQNVEGYLIYREGERLKVFKSDGVKVRK
ncbi:MAG: FAD:protein FMN transferase [Bacteroidales bacterium]